MFRHVFRAQADGARDWVATDRIMGHKDPTMGGHYRDTGAAASTTARLIAVADVVHDWLFPKPTEAPIDEPAKPKRQPRKPKATAVTSDRAASPVRLRIVG